MAGGIAEESKQGRAEHREGLADEGGGAPSSPSSPCCCCCCSLISCYCCCWPRGSCQAGEHEFREEQAERRLQGIPDAPFEATGGRGEERGWTRGLLLMLLMLLIAVRMLLQLGGNNGVRSM